MAKDKNFQKEQISQFCSFLISEEKAAATVSKYCHDIQQFYCFLSEKYNSRLTKENTVSFKNWLLERYHVRSVNSMLTAVNCFLNFLGYQDCRVKLVKVQRQIFYEDKKELRKEEYRRLVDAARKNGNERLAMLLQTLCSLGLRISELKFVTVESVEKGKFQILNKGKNRFVLIPGKLRKRLLWYARKMHLKKGEIFITRSGKALDRSNVWREMKKLGGKAKVEGQKIFPHNLRHLFARTFYELKKDVVKLADLMGHSSIETTRIYTASSGNECLKQLEKLGLVL
ncbi:tyrosine-type recombinase/integrase [[Clostridium] symbiosum]|uniref:tyrosine-type recombinase/integrase n=1 Tax=Clostridium symbiosum TaxID=1512 RepID=UPI001D06B16D|nr:tyrosine-type recombinase/integrase [[Clostridium] symbiosum]MCB6607632.1 tyrosine-type recombinase/integrase [[Clostridium] symbiosum]MCB6929309.1 tyrosine-type recombinase/integrase [[Clostridium] symbiosum]